MKSDKKREHTHTYGRWGIFYSLHLKTAHFKVFENSISIAWNGTNSLFPGEDCCCKYVKNFSSGQARSCCGSGVFDSITLETQWRRYWTSKKRTWHRTEEFILLIKNDLRRNSFVFNNEKGHKKKRKRKVLLVLICFFFGLVLVKK